MPNMSGDHFLCKVYVELMAIKPVCEKFDVFFDDVLGNYIENDCDFPSKMLADFSATVER